MPTKKTPTSTIKKNGATPAKKIAALKNNSGENIVICSIRNLTTGKKIDLDYSKFDFQDGFNKKITATFDTPPASISAAPTDDIQVRWGIKGQNDKYTTKYRAVGGSISVKDKTVTVDGLLDVSKINFSFKGVMEIGPEPRTPATAAARLSVKIGNINPLKEWIIDFSHKEDKLEGSSINLKALLDWVNKKAPDTAGGSELPKVDTSEDTGSALPIEIVNEDGTKTPATAENLKIDFRRLHFNITRKTFHVDVSWLSNDGADAASEADENKKKKEMTFGNFTISDVALVVTNEPFDYDDKVEDDYQDAKEDIEEDEDVEDIVDVDTEEKEKEAEKEAEKEVPAPVN